MTRCTKCGKSIGLFESYEYNKGNPLCMGCYGKSDKQIEEEKKEKEEEFKGLEKNYNLKTIELEIERLQRRSGAEIVLIILGIVGLFFYLIPGIIFFIIVGVISSGRKTKVASLRAQLELLKQSKKSEKEETSALKVLKKRYAEGQISHKEFLKRKKVLKEEQFRLIELVDKVERFKTLNFLKINMKRIIFACIILSLILFACAPQQQTVEENLPAFKLNDVYIWGKSYNFFLIVDKNLTKEEAYKIINKFRNQYPQAVVMNIWMLCDEKYASYQTGILADITDDEFYGHNKHMYFYSNFGGHVEEEFDNRATVGSACQLILLMPILRIIAENGIVVS